VTGSRKGGSGSEAPEAATTSLVVGATGATGRLLVAELVARRGLVRALVRRADRLPEALRRDPRVTVVEASLLDLGEGELARLADGCTAVASCLGHTLTLRGIFGPPHRLVTESVRRLCAAIRANGPSSPVRFVLMNTAGNANRDLHELRTRAEKLALALIRRLVPAHADNEEASDVLRTGVGIGDPAIEWAVVRPDTLVDAAEASRFVAHPSPTRSAIFDAGRTTRVNVARFMAELMTDAETWHRWEGQMPVVYDEGWDARGRRGPSHQLQPEQTARVSRAATQ
jgi:NAD(P)-dependent dehydrogenase (short-subunit alcohol dehydrogenase family)